MTTTPEVSRYPYIDALRGWAILGVLLCHLAWPLQAMFLPAGDWMKAGMYGVQLFYIVSACTLFMSLKNRAEGTVLYYFMRRAFRIWPMYFIALAAYYVYGLTSPERLHFQHMDLNNILAHVFMVHAWHPMTINNILIGGWSVGIEETFYLFVPLAFIYIKTLERALALFVVSVPVAILSYAWALQHTAQTVGEQYGMFAYYWLPNQLPVFFLGFVFYHVLQMPKPAPEVLKERMILALTVAGVLLFAAFSPRPLVSFPQHILAAMGFVIAVYAVSIWPHKVLVNRVTCWLGKTSFSLYLLNILFFHMHEDLLSAWFSEHGMATNHWVVFAFYLLITIPALLLVSTLTFRYIEEPCRLAGGRVIAWLKRARGEEAQRRGTKDGAIVRRAAITSAAQILK